MTDPSGDRIDHSLALARATLATAPSGLLSDLDGTLAPIVADPAAARPVPAAVQALTTLAGQLAVVGVVTGRAAADARRLLGTDALLVIGNHGLEWLEPGQNDVPPLPGLAWAAEAVEGIVAALRLEPGVWVERKGLSATVHYRGAGDPPAARERLLAALGDVTPQGLALRPGRMSVELRPMGAGDKGTAVERAITRYALRGLVLLGDDVTDLDMFRAAAGARAAGRLAATILAVAGAGEVPPAVAAAADAVLPDPAAAAELLSALAAGFPG
ncbi:MAG TPA: trehalose-phosphatase [Candidatus Limnocylindrales bacterium]|nr:trehalose-phosphatase [Candidatus Limnocylindrales bacterium]